MEIIKKNLILGAFDHDDKMDGILVKEHVFEKKISVNDGIKV